MDWDAFFRRLSRFYSVSEDMLIGKSVENPKKFIVSCRINDTEMQQLKKIAKQSGTNISNLLRQSLLGLTRVES